MKLRQAFATNDPHTYVFSVTSTKLVARTFSPTKACTSSLLKILTSREAIKIQRTRQYCLTSRKHLGVHFSLKQKTTHLSQETKLPSFLLFKILHITAILVTYIQLSLCMGPKSVIIRIISLNANKFYLPARWFQPKRAHLIDRTKHFLCISQILHNQMIFYEETKFYKVIIFERLLHLFNPHDFFKQVLTHFTDEENES